MVIGTVPLTSLLSLVVGESEVARLTQWLGGAATSGVAMGIG